MEQINIYNYEAYLLDYTEGNLTDHEQMELELFLIQNPDLNIDLTELKLIECDKNNTIYLDKASLKKSEKDLVSEDQFIQYIEHQLPEHEQLELEKSCTINPILLKELHLYKHTISLPDVTVVYPHKNQLKRKPKVIWFNFSTVQYAAAACILFLIGFFVLWPKDETNNHSSIATKSNNIIPQNVAIKNENQTSSIKGYPSDISIKENDVPVQKSNTNKIKSQNVVSQSNSTLLANHTTSNNNSKKDSITKSLIEQVPNQQNETLIASNTPIDVKKQNNNVVQVITESDDEPPLAHGKKKGLWAAATKVLKSLNKAGVKAVNGNEQDSNEKSSYALTLGDLNITHKAGNL